MLKRLGLATAVLLLLVSLVPQPTEALSIASGSGLSISPTIYQYTLKPGQSATMSITLKNVTTGDITAQGQVNDFVSDGTSGSPKILSLSSPTTPTSIKKFVGTVYDVPLTVGQQKTLSIGVNIPSGTPPGAYFGVIRYRSVPAGANVPNPNQVALTASVATVVLITVPGNIRTLVKFDAIHIYHGTKDSSFFLTKPDKIGIEIQNLGNGFARPFGTVEVQSMFHKNISTFQFNNPKQLGNVLPNSTRIFKSSFNGVSQPGRYTVLANVAYDNSGNVLTIKKTFWYVPAWLALIVLAIIIILLLLTIRLYFRYRRDAKHSYRR